MAAQDESALHISWPAIIAFLVAVYGLIAARPSLQSPRPTAALANRSTTPDQGVPSRLWQDPLSALHGERPAKRLDPCVSDVVRQRPPVSEPQNKVLFLFNYLDPENTPEEGEARRRKRYATLSALSTAGYAPAQSDRIRIFTFVLTSGGKNPGATAEELPIPYEWLSRLPAGELKNAHPQYDGVCVLWVSRPADAPHEMGVLCEIKQELGWESEVVNLGADFAIAGRLNSSPLMALLEQDNGLVEYGPKPLAGVVLYVTDSTAPFVRHEFPPGAVLAKSGLALEYVIDTDDHLAKGLVEELTRRGLAPGSEDDPVAVVAEWDTQYGRAMHSHFKEAIGDEARHVHHYSYLRGLDGVVPGKPGESPKPPADGGDEAGAPRQAARVPTSREGEGEAQFDYLRRLAERMRGDHHPFKAVGIVGSDVYDKLLLLRGLRPYFPRALFFTTDLDVRLLQPGEYADTRNLLIAAPYGLTLKDEYPNPKNSVALQGGVAPFRSSYDTACYLGTLRAVKHLDVAPQDKWQRHLFEVGRNGAYELTLFNEQVTDPFGAKNPPQEPWIAQHGHFWILLLAVLVAAVMLYPMSRPWQRFLHSAARTTGLLRRGEPDADSTGPAPWVGVFVALAVLAAGALTYLIYYAHTTDGEEPFELFEGLSVWPTVVLRVVAIGLCAYYVATTLERLGERNSKTHEQFFSGEAKRESPRDVEDCLRLSFSAWGWDSKEPSAQQLYAQFEGHGAWWRRVVRCTLLVALNLLLFILLWGLFDHTMVTARGDVARWVNPVVLFLAGLSLVVLLMFIVDCTLLSFRFVTLLSRVERVWPPDLVTREAERRGLVVPPPGGAKDAGREAVEQLLFVRLIDSVTNVVARRIYCPFVVLLVLIVAQNRLFNDWHWNIPLAIIALFCAAVAVVCGLLLQRSAKGAKAKALEALDGLLLPGAGRPAGEGQEKLARIRADVDAVSTGAFANFAQNPVVGAVLLPLGGGGGLAALELLLTYL